MTAAEQERLRQLALRAFAVEFCNAPVREGESKDEAKQSLKETPR